MIPNVGHRREDPRWRGLVKRCARVVAKVIECSGQRAFPEEKQARENFPQMFRSVLRNQSSVRRRNGRA